MNYYRIDTEKILDDSKNIIHAKFGDFRKIADFEKGFEEKYPEFHKEYMAYFWNEESIFKTPFDILNYVEEHKIPVDFYFNFIDEFAEDIEAVREYLRFEGKFTE